MEALAWLTPASLDEFAFSIRIWTQGKNEAGRRPEAMGEVKFSSPAIELKDDKLVLRNTSGLGGPRADPWE